MTDLWQVRVLYEGGPGMPGTNTLYASTEDTDVDDLRTALGTFYDFWADNHMSNQITATIPAAGDKIGSDTGDLVGVWASGTADAHPGGLSTQRLPYTSQFLLQLHTDFVVGGRVLRGRVFLPGATEGDGADGVPDPSSMAGVVSAANTAFAGRLCVYSTTHHEFATVTSVSGWNQWAVLRSRRD